MKKYISLYKDTDFGDIRTEEQMEDFFYGSLYEDVYYTFNEFIVCKVDEGVYEEILADLSDSKTVYPYYFIADYDEVVTIMEFYKQWQLSHDWKSHETFGDFLNTPQIDRNCTPFYGFEQ